MPDHNKQDKGHVVTYGLASYKRAFNAEFYDHHQSCKHVADVGLQRA